MWPLPTPPTPWTEHTWRPAHPARHRAGHELPAHSVMVAGEGPMADEVREAIAACPDTELAGSVADADDVVEAIIARRPDFALLCDPPDPTAAMLLTMRLAWVVTAPTTRLLALSRGDDHLVLSSPRRLSSLEQELVLGLCRSLVAGEPQIRGA